jgi:hypothetical protein
MKDGDWLSFHIETFDSPIILMAFFAVLVLGRKNGHVSRQKSSGARTNNFFKVKFKLTQFYFISHLNFE